MQQYIHMGFMSNGITNPSVLDATFEDTRMKYLGDIYFAQGKQDQAHDAYLEAISQCKDKKIAINPVLQMKFDNLIKEGETPAFREAAKLDKEIRISSTKVVK